MLTVDDYSAYDIDTLIEAEKQLRFAQVGHPSEFRVRQIQRRLADIRDEIAFRSSFTKQIG